MSHHFFNDCMRFCPHPLDPTLNFLLTCLQKKPLSTVAANALQNVCSTCKTQMASHFSGLLQIIQAIDTFSISNEAAVGLLKGICSFHRVFKNYILVLIFLSYCCLKVFKHTMDNMRV